MTRVPGISVVIANYNYGRFVGLAIESALAQDHPKVEVIVVDDGSTDGSRTVIASFGDRIRAVYQTNQGQVAASNAGWPLTRHEIVLFLDADDLLMPDAASAIAAAWEPRVSKVQWTLQVVDAAGQPVGVSYPKYPPDLSPETIRQALLRTGAYPCPPTSGNAYARGFLEAVSPIKAHKMDGFLTSLAPLYGDVVTLDRLLGAYRCHESNVSEQSTITTSRFQRYVANEEVRMALLERCCRRLGIPFDLAAAKARNVWYQEAQLMAAKLARRRSLASGRRAIAAILQSPQSRWQRAVRALWAGMVVALPAPVARRLIEMRFVTLRRPRAIERIVRAFERGGEARRPFPFASIE